MLKNIKNKLSNNVNSKSNTLLKPILATPLFKALHKVWTLPKLPPYGRLNKFYNNIFVRAFRVIGGICFILMVSHIYIDWPLSIKLFIDIIATIQIMQMFVFGFIKGFYAAYILIYYPQLLEVRN